MVYISSAVTIICTCVCVYIGPCILRPPLGPLCNNDYSGPCVLRPPLGPPYINDYSGPCILRPPLGLCISSCTALSVTCMPFATLLLCSRWKADIDNLISNNLGGEASLPPSLQPRSLRTKECVMDIQTTKVHLNRLCVVCLRTHIVTMSCTAL